MVIRIKARRFRCREAECSRRTFCEPLDAVIDRRYARRTARSEALVHQIALAMGGRPGERLTARLCIGGSRDTLIRLIRRRSDAPERMAEVTALGIDDWAWRKGATYGTILYDLEGRLVLGLLADRDATTVEAWLSAHGQITVIARDRGGTYAPGSK
jgi:transposase